MSDHEPILRCEEDLRAAQLAGDVATLDRLLDDELVFVAIDGNVVGKADDFELHRSRRLRITRMDPVERRVRRFGALAVVTVRMEAAATLDGASVSGPLRYTRVWRDTGDGWRIVAGHMSAITG